MGYVYRHIRLDKYEVFYIGISQSNNGYNRAYQVKSRNKHWHNIINKSAYKVEILFEHEDFETIKKKEIEFIKLYGRLDLGE